MKIKTILLVVLLPLVTITATSFTYSDMDHVTDFETSTILIDFDCCKADYKSINETYVYIFSREGIYEKKRYVFEVLGVELQKKDFPEVMKKSHRYICSLVDMEVKIMTLQRDYDLYGKELKKENVLYQKLLLGKTNAIEKLELLGFDLKDLNSKMKEVL